MPQKSIFATPLDAEAAFYDALEQGDLEAVMAVWAEDEEIVCVHPGGPRLVGYATIREAWRRLFAGGNRLQIRPSRQSLVQNPFTSIHSVLEQLSAEDPNRPRAMVVATNIYVRGALGWRLVLHHASTAPPDLAESPVPKTLH
jgi:ketosteroid isomerase-like protein